MPLDDASRRPLREYWLAEIIRLRETHWGPLEDAEAVRARRAEGGLPDRILVRAHRLAEREQLPAQLQGWTRSALAVLAALFALALFSGIGLALGALGDGARPVNVLWALGALLGLHALTFLLWLASFLLRPAAATGLGRLWLWVTRSRGPDTALAPQALLNLLARAAALAVRLDQPPALADRVVRRAGDAVDGAVHRQLPLHLGHHAARAGHLRLADPGDRLAAGPGGLPLPDAATVLASDGVQTLPAAAQVQWSLWLIGVVVVYGVLPRLAAALLCLVVLRRRLAGLRIDPALPGHAALRDRLEPAVVSTGLDRPSTRCTSRACPRRRLPGWTAVRCCWRWNCPPTCPGRRPQPRRHPDRRPARHARGTPPHPRRAGRRRRLAPPDRLRRPPDAGPGHAHADRRTGRARSRRASGCCCPRTRMVRRARAVARAARGAGPARAGRAGGIRQRAGLAGDRTWLIP